MLNEEKTSVGSIILFVISLVFFGLAIFITVKFIPMIITMNTSTNINGDTVGPEMGVAVALLLGFSYLIGQFVVVLFNVISIIISLITTVRIYKNEESKILFIISVTIIVISVIICILVFVLPKLI